MVVSDYDSVNIFKETADFINGNNIVYSMINFVTPTPGSNLHKRLESQSRLFEEDWEKYNGEYVCFKPKKMTVEELEAGRSWLLNEVYSYRNIYKRLSALWKKEALIRKGSDRKLFTKGRLFFIVNTLRSMDIKRLVFILKSLWNRRVTSIGAISLALSFHDYSEALSYKEMNK